MRAVILAAGRGTRIAAVHANPKCLLRFGRQTLLDHQIRSLTDAGIRQIALVVSYEKEQIVQHVRQSGPPAGVAVRFITNPQFGVTNNIYSLGLARNWVRNHAFVCLNADVLFHPRILELALRSTAAISLVVDPDYREETAKVIIRHGRVVALSKSIRKREASGTFVNMAKFTRRGARLLFTAIESMLDEGQVNVFFNEAIMRLSRRGVPVRFTSSQGLPWAEIDDPADLNYARRIVHPAIFHSEPRKELMGKQGERLSDSIVGSIA